MRNLILLCAGALSMTACAPSPYYVQGQVLIPGEVPRNAYGKPVLSAMKPPPAITEVGSSFGGGAADIPDIKPLPTSPDRPLR
ncbi:hypothetical protein KCG44_07190 [Pacificimonas sp. WHA3]|uniref:Lipoprotein n=1 Tax=Pacificimonas pallii TaxID=2827236 RepID=A0ABS6SDS0_9SPHN|nr:hypothetical protein [Pacificimonas pallii]MBV7256568.1 hypothetical protein [Pacificimonas pallii]